jgi:hypothetical protein
MLGCANDPSILHTAEGVLKVLGELQKVVALNAKLSLQGPGGDPRLAFAPASFQTNRKQPREVVSRGSCYRRGGKQSVEGR